MSRPNPALLLAFLIAVVAIFGGVAVAKGGFYIAKHEGDTFHLLQIVFRMADGEWPHLDFMTPIGILAFWPMVVFLKGGYGIADAIVMSQVLVAAALLPMVFWTAYTRFSNGLAYLFGFTTMVLVLALVHGEANDLISISMHYNRWAWAISYVAIALAVLPAMRAKSDMVDGIVIGGAMAALVLCKVTYFAAFAPAIIIALLARGNPRTLITALIVGLACVAVFTLFSGLDFWWAYIDDLRTVAASEIRPQPGKPLLSVVGAPAYFGGTLALILGVVLLREAGEKALGLSLLVLLPGFFYVTFQNFGNDPQWLMLLAVLLLVPRPAPEITNAYGWNMGRALSLAAMAAIAFATPSMLNLAFSPFRHMGFETSDYAPMLANRPVHHGLQGRIIRSNRVDGTMGIDGPGTGLEDRSELADRDRARTEFMGEEFPDCELRLGLVAWFETIVADLEAKGYGQGKRIFAADIFSSFWLFGDIERLPNGSPWYYGGLPGFEAADYMLVPLCPASEAVRKEILDQLTEQGVEFTEVHRTPLYVLYQPVAG